jgi:hypothetical protein
MNPLQKLETTRTSSYMEIVLDTSIRKGVHVLLMLFVFIYVYWCLTLFPCKMMFMSSLVFVGGSCFIDVICIYLRSRDEPNIILHGNSVRHQYT